MIFINPFLLEYYHHIMLPQEEECALYTTVKLVKLEKNRSISKDADTDFFFELQRGVLLSLKEASKLTEVQYRNAEETLKEQRRVIICARVGGGTS
jgi:hypothetical protein